MKYYIDTIEQVKTEDGGVNEYGARVKKNDFSSAQTEFYTKLANVSNDLVIDGKNHYYMNIRVVNSEGGIVIKPVNLGEYVPDVEPEPTPEPVQE